MPTPVRILYVEDRSDDVTLVDWHLRRAGYAPTLRQVQTEAEMRAALAEAPWDLVLSDFGLPGFGAPQALQVLTDSRLDLPFIILSGTIDEQQAVSTLRAGAGDFVLKGSLARLVPAIERELREARLRREQRAAVAAVERRFQALVELSADAITLFDREGRVLYDSPAVARILGYAPAELDGRQMWALFHPDDTAASQAQVRQLLAQPGAAAGSEFRLRHCDGSWRWIEAVTRNLLHEPAVQALVVNYRDITERKQAEALIRRQLERLAALRAIDQVINTSLDLRLTLDVFLEQVVAQLGVDAAGVLLANPLTNSLEYAAGRGFRGRHDQHLQPRIGEGHAGQAALERRLVSVPDLRALPARSRRTGLLGGEDFVSYYAAPLIAKGQVKGVLEVFHRAPLAPQDEWLDFLEALSGQAALAIDNAELFSHLQTANQELRLAYDATIEGWSNALDLRDHETEGHSRRVTAMTLRLARQLGLPDATLVHLHRGALLHDIGKLGVPDGILLKPGPLTPDEWQQMRRHPELAYQLLSPIAFLRPALEIPLYHHEKWDGTGYPHQLKGEAIPLSARIFAVVDVYDALRSHRPYRPAWSAGTAAAHLRAEAGRHFEPRLVDVFLATDPEGYYA
jgi:PAS domain S-box-containing protein